MPKLDGKVALVTGASRGIGKGIALGLGEAGATVYITGRSLVEEASDVSGTLNQTAAEVRNLGAHCVPIRCDHRSDEEVESVFKRIMEEQSHLDILVNSVWGGYENMVEGGEFTWNKPFWQQPIWRWDSMFQAGVRAHFTASRLAAPIMVSRKSGLIVNVSYWAARKHMGNVMYGVSKSATDKLTADMADELRPHEVAVVCIYPGLVRTERVMLGKGFFDLSNSESPQFVGRAVAALAGDPKVMQKSGRVLVVASLGKEYGFADIDGKHPNPLTIDTA